MKMISTKLNSKKSRTGELPESAVPERFSVDAYRVKSLFLPFSISEFNSTSNSTRAHEELTDLLPLEPSKEVAKLEEEPEDKEDEGQNHKKGTEKKKNEENKDEDPKSSTGKPPENRGPRRETYKQKIIDTIIQRFG